MAVLLDLPNEVLHLICTALCPHCLCDTDTEFNLSKNSLISVSTSDRSNQSIRALAFICRASHRLYAIGIPVLYHQISEAVFFRSCTTLFLRTVCRRAEFAANVMHVVVNTWVGLNPGHNTILNDATKALGIIPLSINWGKYPISYEEDEEAENIRRRHAFVIDLILGFAFNLDHLSLRVSPGLRIGGNLPPTTHFYSLTKLQVTNFHSSEGFSPQILEPLFARAPNLEYLELSRCFSAPSGELLRKLKVLKFFMSMLSQGSLKSIASYCKDLQVFVFRDFQATKFSRPVIDNPVTVKDLIEEMIPCRETLRHLEVDIGTSSGRADIDKNEIIPTLAQFPILKIVKLGERYVCCKQELN